MKRKRRDRTKINTVNKPRPTTREGRQPRSKPTPEWLAHFKREVGSDWEGHHDIRARSTLTIIEARGQLTGNSLALRTAGERFKHLYISRYGPVDGKASSIGSMTGKGSIGLPREATDLDDIERTKAFKKLNKKLFKIGKRVHEEVINVAVCGNKPVWLEKLIAGHKIDKNCRERDDLIIGLESLIY